MSASAWSTQQLAEFLAVVSLAETEAAASRATVERTAEELDAEVAAIVSGGELLAAVGYPDGAVPLAELAGLAPGVEGALTVPGLGVCSATAVRLDHPPGARLVVARCGTGLGTQEVSLLRGIAHASSITMRMLRLLDDERAAREDSARRQTQFEQLANEQAALRRMATLVARGASPPETFSAVAAEVGQLLGADVTMVLRYDPDGTGTVTGGWSIPGVTVPEGSGLTVAGAGVAVSVLRTGQPARTEHFEGPPGSLPARFRQLGVRSGVGTPITVEGRLWGVVVAASRQAQQLPPGSESRIANFTELVGTAIANAQARVELRRIADEQAALRRVATLVARSRPPAEVFLAVAKEMRDLLGAEITTIMRFEPDATAILLAGAGSTARLGSRWTLEPPLAVEAVYRTGRPARVDDYGHASGEVLDKIIHPEGVCCSVVSPIIVGGRLWGAITASTRHDPLPTDTEQRMVDFTELVATAIANTQDRAELTASRARIVAAADETRRRLERDLHDGVQQRLVSLALTLRGAEKRVPPELSELQAMLSQTAEGLTGVFTELQEISRGIHPAILSQGGLAPALKTLARRSAIPVELSVRAQRRLPERVEVAAYYVVAEALANIAKHAHASAAYLDVDADASALRLRMRDDGVGGADPGRGSGLIGLTDRVEALGGTIEIESPPGKGTSLHVTLPITAA